MTASASAPRRLLITLAGVGILALAMGGPVLAGDDGDINQPIDFTHNGIDESPVAGAVFGTDGSLKPGQTICTTTTSTAANVNTDCETSKGPHNETSIAVNPTDHANIIGGANDYQLGLNKGGHVTESLLSRAHVTFDGGQTWSMYPIIFDSSYQASGDPSVAFDAAGHAYYATLGFRFVGPVNAQSPDVLVANSGDGGKTWSSVKIASGSGVFTSVGNLLDKEYVTAWGDGNAIVTFGLFRDVQKGATVSGQIYASVTHDAGAHWSAPTLISGDLDQSFVSVPTVSNGRVFVAFMNTDDLDSGRDTYKVVEVSPSTGAKVAGPFDVGLVIDGRTDYPLAFGRQTHQDSLFRSWAAGNITADPTTPGHLAVVWSDMRNSTTPAPADPYTAVTNSDVIVSESTDYGRTWSTPVAAAMAGDQFMPWGAYDGAGTLRIGTFDRSTDADNHKYDYTLLTQTGPASFSPSVITTVQSDPTKNDRWFRATLDPDFPGATTFLGDYSNIAVVPGTTHTVAYWTDLREQACFPAGVCGSGEDAYFAYGS